MRAIMCENCIQSGRTLTHLVVFDARVSVTTHHFTRGKMPAGRFGISKRRLGLYQDHVESYDCPKVIINLS
ncbi:uncharacterized protein BKA55DRAFT_564431 [Fusarium redolens]|uniref:Uncharacterized protein n=1 Tax=Fusarium redolens TaxID=48865 RepID=A0A9P9HDM6_FUSRE|nr:uncharacterized protein BKA55DRAFT_564431 [Fusarium redolens]KAH7255571.1 hypothetical protein BKA55DRAFT_564431 [Fusarium redolens]